MDLEILEALALAPDRSQALGQLLPGSEDHDYFRCLHAQHRGALDEAAKILDVWTERHGHTDRYERLRQRQLWYRLDREVDEVSDELRDHFGVDHSHEAEVPELDPSRPTKLAPGTFDGAALLAEAVEYDNDLTQVTDEGLLELLGADLSSSRRRALLSRIGHSPRPELVALVAADLDVRYFGQLSAHQQLTLDQLHALAARKPELRTHRTWIEFVLRRMQPPVTVDLELDLATRETYIRELWAFVAPLPPAMNSLKAHVLWHLLDTLRRRDVTPDLALVVMYLQLPRSAGYLPQRWIERIRNDEIAQLGADFRGVTGLPPAGDDEELVRDLLRRNLSSAEQFAQWLERTWLDIEIATAQLLLGVGDPDKATRILGPSAAAALRERVELAWCAHNPKQFRVDEPIVLEADVKHVPELVVKVFRIDPLAYFQHNRREVNTDLDLDGLAASHEQTMHFSEPAVRRVRRRIELPMCARPGTYVIDLIGNGIASRALVTKGRLRYVSRVGAPGTLVTILDEAGRPRPDARAWLGDREYTPDAEGTFVVPFSTSPASQAMLLSCGDIATVAYISLVSEAYALDLALSLDRQALTDGATARAIARLRLTVAGAPVSLALLEQPQWSVSLTDRQGVTTTKSFPLALSDDNAAVLELPLGEAIAYVSVAVSAKVKVISEQREQDLAQSAYVQVAEMHATTDTEALYLARTSSHGWVLSALGKTGEPRAQRPLTITLVHRWALTELNVELATDAYGRCELGELPGISRITAVLGDQTQTWNLLDEPRQLTLNTRDVLIALPPSRTADEVIARASLVELRGGAPARHASATIEPASALFSASGYAGQTTRPDRPNTGQATSGGGTAGGGAAGGGGIVIRGLPPGDYWLRAPGVAATIRVPRAGVDVATSVLTESEVVELTRREPVIADVTISAGGASSGGATSGGASSGGDELVVRVLPASPRTRVHVIATRFIAAPSTALGSVVPAAQYRFDRARGAAYVSGRELGDEYRYILERRTAKRFPSVIADKPSLLLNPWARRTTSTAVAHAATGRAFAASAPAPMAGGYYRQQAQEPAAGNSEAYVAYDFLPERPVVIANLIPDNGVVRVPMSELGRATCVTVIADDVGGGRHVRQAFLRETALEPKDLRLRLALDPSRPTTQQKSIAPLAPAQSLVIADLATAKVHLLDSVEKAHAYLLALRDDPTLREFAFVTRWHSTADAERRELYSKYACHELHLFLYFRDRAFFDAVVKPYLAHKRVKTFVDHWLLEADLRWYLEPARLERLNAVERALLAQRLRADPELARMLADEVLLIPPDPARDTRLIDALLGASALDGDEQMKGFAADALQMAESAAAPMMELARGGFGAGAPGAAMPPPMPQAAPAKPKAAKKRAMEKMDDADEEVAADEPMDSREMERDMSRRREAAPMFRAQDKTQEWAENNWWHLTPAESSAELIAVNRLWRDFARHEGGAFLSPSLGLATNSFAEAMCALAVTDLPFVVPAHAYNAEGPTLTITAAGNSLVGTSQLVAGELVPGGAPLVVGQSYVRTDDRHQWVDGEQVDKYVEGSFLAGVVYTCQIVLANPSSSRQRIAALVQIPRGSMPLAGARPTHTLDVVLEPYGTHGHEYSFYFPAPGEYTHFPVHVSRGGTIVAAAPSRPLIVTADAEQLDLNSWPHISQRGSIADVVAYLGRANLAEIELERVAWRIDDRAAYDAILGVLERRHAYDETLWGYALLHNDLPRIKVWARTLGDRLLSAGPVLEMLGIDSEALGSYEHLEYAPLTNARAHRLGSKLRILNDGLSAQYTRFLELVAHRPAPTAEDVLAFAMYLLAQDRNEAALAALARVDTTAISDKLQHDYLAAYAACLTGEVRRAKELVAMWRGLPVDRWRRKFEAIGAMLAELDGAAPAIVDPRSRDQQQSELAAKQPTFDIALDRDGVVIRQQHVGSLELRFFEMDVELLFSRQPFVQSDVSRFSFIEPGYRETLTGIPVEHRVPWPAALRGKNVVVEAVGVGQRKAKIHYANDLATNIAQQYGQVRVQRASDHGSLSATYVKVYARHRGGAVEFYKDGYTDLRGWFDYATLSTNDLERVERFAILVVSDQAGSAIFEATPPMR
ncbi:MAG TPA: hypothetical protein VMZ53_13030 [Kofleriaceae bacterium]|nr:hypothetical protein [Kofleriaceae bacterium]